jgi:tRNA(fMet)-specific endonuclease VapC
MVLLDTNIVSYLLRGHTLAEAYRPILSGNILAISFMTIAELYEGAGRAGWGAPRLASLEAALRSYVVIPFNIDICRQWANVRVARKSQPIAVDDAWIAATALTHGIALVTHNPADFLNIPGLSVMTLRPTR